MKEEHFQVFEKADPAELLFDTKETRCLWLFRTKPIANAGSILRVYCRMPQMQGKGKKGGMEPCFSFLIVAH